MCLVRLTLGGDAGHSHLKLTVLSSFKEVKHYEEGQDNFLSRVWFSHTVLVRADREQLRSQLRATS